MSDVDLVVHDGADLHPFWLCRFPVGEQGGWGLHRHEQHQLIWVRDGVGTVLTPGASWITTPAKAIWVPSGLAHDVVIRQGAGLYCLYVWPEHCPLGWTATTEVVVTPLVREVLISLDDDTLESPVTAASMTVLFGHLARQDPPAVPTLCLPRDARAADVARGILADPSDQRTLDEWADAVATSPSTLQRAFLTETSSTFSDWRTRARLDASLPLLATGMSLEQTARRVGYASRSGFIDAFRRHFGRRPRAGEPLRRAFDMLQDDR